MKENIIFESKDFQYLCSYFFKNLSSEKKKKKIELKVFQNKSLGFIVLEIEQEINNKNFPKRKLYSYILGDIYEREVFFYSNLGSSFTNKSLNEPEALIELDKNKNYFYWCSARPCAARVWAFCGSTRHRRRCLWVTWARWRWVRRWARWR